MSAALLALAAAAVLVGCAALARGVRRRKIHVWLPAYLRQIVVRGGRRARRAAEQHLLFCFVDHFEPGWNKADLARQRARVDGWVERYPALAEEFRDADGRPPRHTWFYPPHYYREEHLQKLIALCARGLGEIELHLHHNRMEPFPDTSATLREKIGATLALYARHGIFVAAVNGRPALRYAFIHGDWALDNSRPEYCGVNDELTILRETGCYADFTFPSYMVESQPRTINAIYYAADDPAAPKSYERGVPVRVGGSGDGALMMVQGPLGLRLRGRRRWLPAVDDGEIAANNPPTNERVDFWVRTGVHVEGRPEWRVVKVFTHGAPRREHEVLLGDAVRRMHRHLRERYNDGKDFRLHYVTARELYNVIRAAEAGRAGDPGDYRDFEIGPYACCLRGGARC